MEAEPIEIRAATTDDLGRLAVFLQPFVDAKQILPRSEEELRILVRHGFVAECQGEIAGFAAIEIYSKKLAEVQAMTVSEKFRGRGVGKKLLNACVDRAKVEGVLELMAITMSEDLFRSVGFDYALPNQKRALFIQTRAHD